MPQTVSNTGRRRRIPISPQIQSSSVQDFNTDGILYILGDNNTEHSWRLISLESPRRLVLEHRGAFKWEERSSFLDIISYESVIDQVITDLLGNTIESNLGNLIEAAA